MGPVSSAKQSRAAQGVLTPPSCAQPGNPPPTLFMSPKVWFTLVWASGPVLPPGETLDPERKVVMHQEKWKAAGFQTGTPGAGAP